ncbi:FtsX-like permease family protein [Solibacillus sp. FSL R7-0668]|uniref:FtsX-like permease family protein n=1 Tax=Solibacillus sp. FSL R7-0668 TaxID=2921688 RepID=UPI0030F7E77D
MFDLRTIAWKLCKAAKTHVITSICIIAVTICLIVTMATYIHNAKNTLDANIDAMFGEMDILAGYNYGQGQYVSDDLLEQIAELPDVDALSPISLEMTDINQLQGVYTLGVENDALVKSRYHFEQDLTQETVIVSELLAKTLDVAVNDDIVLNDKAYTVMEVLPTPMGAEPFQMALVHNDELKESGFTALFMLIQTDEMEAVANALHSFDSQLRVDIVNEYDFIKMNLQALLIFVVVLSVFVLLITALLLISTMQLLFTKLKEQLMILRSLGASTTQIAKLVQIQLVSIVCLGLIFGTALSFATIHFALPQLIKWMQLPEASTEFPIVLVVGIVLTVGLLLTGYMLRQVRKATNILPLQIVNDTEPRTFVLTKWKLIVVGISTVMAFLLLLVGQLDPGGGKGTLQILLGSLWLALLFLYMIPFTFQWLLKAVLRPIRLLFGREAYLACQQLIPQIRVNIKIVLTLVGLVVILVFGSSVLKSLQANEQAYLNERFEAQYILSNPTGLKGSSEILTELQKMENTVVKRATSMGSSISMSVDGETFDLFAENLNVYGIEGLAENKIVVTEKFAKAENIAIGDWISPYFLDYELLVMQQQPTFEVVKIIATEQSYVGAYIDWSSAYAQNQLPIREIKLDTANSGQLERLLSLYPMFHLLEKSEAIEQANTMFYQRWSLFVGVFIVLLVATTIGIIQTLMHLVYTNRSQYTIQRLLGLSPNGLVKYLCMQVLSFVLYGLMTGLLIGALLTRLVSLIDKEAGQFAFDFATIGVVCAGLVVLLLLVFGVQGYMISRRKLSEEMVEL